MDGERSGSECEEEEGPGGGSSFDDVAGGGVSRGESGFSSGPSGPTGTMEAASALKKDKVKMCLQMTRKRIFDRRPRESSIDRLHNWFGQPAGGRGGYSFG